MLKKERSTREDQRSQEEIEKSIKKATHVHHIYIYTLCLTLHAATCVVCSCVSYHGLVQVDKGPQLKDDAFARLDILDAREAAKKTSTTHEAPTQHDEASVYIFCLISKRTHEHF